MRVDVLRAISSVSSLAGHGTRNAQAEHQSRAPARAPATLRRWPDDRAASPRTSSPAPHPRPSARATWNDSVVMFSPNTISSADAFPNRSANADCACANDRSSVSMLVGYAPVGVGIVIQEILRLIASTTDTGTCVPPGPSKYATGRPRWPRPSAGNCARIVSGGIGRPREPLHDPLESLGITRPGRHPGLSASTSRTAISAPRELATGTTISERARAHHR